jgi:hypothetical protein
MSYELTAILVVGVVMGLAQAAAIVIAVSGFGALIREMDRHFEQTRGEVSRAFEAMDRRFEEMSRLNRTVAALVVQESEKIQTLLRT